MPTSAAAAPGTDTMDAPGKPSAATLVPTLAAELRTLANQVDALDAGQTVGELERLKFQVWTTATNPGPPGASDEDTLLDAVGVAAALGVPEKQARKLITARAFPVVRVGARYVRVRRCDLDAYVAARRTAVAPPVAPGYTIPYDKEAASASPAPHPANDPTRPGRRTRRPRRDHLAVGDRLESDSPHRRHRHHAPRGKAGSGEPLDVGAADTER
jgi:hypothetical protein